MKVLQGHALDEETPLVVGQAPAAGNGETVPVYYRGGGTQATATAMVYDYNSEVAGGSNPSVEKEPGEECAQYGCLFSFFPPVGVITCCLHSDAPSNSKRAMWAHMAFLISCAVFIVLVVYFMETYVAIGEPTLG
jgi:hypothetical protein